MPPAATWVTRSPGTQGVGSTTSLAASTMRQSIRVSVKGLNLHPSDCRISCVLTCCLTLVDPMRVPMTLVCHQ